LGGHKVRLLAAIVGDAMQVVVAARTGVVISSDHDFDSRQMGWHLKATLSKNRPVARGGKAVLTPQGAYSPARLVS
jgi:hypothetical protein